MRKEITDVTENLTTLENEKAEALLKISEVFIYLLIL